MHSPEFYMQRCLELAQKGQGNTHPNPMVGAVVLNSQGEIVGEGYHHGYGHPHAEVEALRQAGDMAQGGSIYVNLEPCNHQGQTPPCTQAVLAAGITHVTYGIADPNPTVVGHGKEFLERAGLKVTHGILEAACRKLNEAWLYRVTTNRPFVVIKQAMTLDGKIATRTGDSQWITAPELQAWVHQLRAQSDAILTTAETILQDDSRLTVRAVPLVGPPPIRIVLDRQGRLTPERCKLFSTNEPIYLFTRPGLQLDRFNAYPQVQVINIADTGNGLDLAVLLAYLGKEKRITQLMVEAGGKLVGSLLEENLAQKLWLLYGNQFLLDPAARPGIQGNPRAYLAESIPCEIESCQILAGNIVLEAYLDNKSPASFSKPVCSEIFG